MNILNIETGRYPMTQNDVIAEVPKNVSINVPFECPPGYAYVNPIEPPEFDAVTQHVIEDHPAQDEHGYHQTWIIVDFTADELVARSAAAQAAAQAQAVQLLGAVSTEAQRRLDAFAATRRYDGIISLCSYAISTNPVRKAEGERGVVLRDQVWDVLIELEQGVVAGTTPMPTSIEQALAGLPALTWDEVPPT